MGMLFTKDFSLLKYLLNLIKHALLFYFEFVLMQKLTSQIYQISGYQPFLSTGQLTYFEPSSRNPTQFQIQTFHNALGITHVN